MSYPLDAAIIEALVPVLLAQHDHPTFATPLAHALAGLLTDPVPWYWKGNVLHIRSRTKDTIYRCTGTRCTCPARVTTRTPLGWCWHKVAWYLLIAERAITDPFGLVRR